MDVNEDKGKLVSRGWDSFDRSFTANENASYATATWNDGWTVNCVNDMSEQIDNLTKQVNNTAVSLDGLKGILDRIPPEVMSTNIGGWTIEEKVIHKIYRRDFKTSFLKAVC